MSQFVLDLLGEPGQLVAYRLPDRLNSAMPFTGDEADMGGVPVDMTGDQVVVRIIGCRLPSASSTRATPRSAVERKWR